MAFSYKHRGTTYYYSQNQNPNQQQFQQNGYNAQAYNQQQAQQAYNQHQQSPQTYNQPQQIQQTPHQQQQIQQKQQIQQTYNQQQQNQQTHNQQHQTQQQQIQQTHDQQQQTQQQQIQQTYNQQQQIPQIAYQQQAWAPISHRQLTKTPQNKSYMNNYAGKGNKATKTQLPSNASCLIQPSQNCCVLIRSSSAKMFKKDLDYVFRHYRPSYLGSRVVRTTENQKTMFQGIAYFDSMFTG